MYAQLTRKEILNMRTYRDSSPSQKKKKIYSVSKPLRIYFFTKEDILKNVAEKSAIYFHSKQKNTVVVVFLPVFLQYIFLRVQQKEPNKWRMSGWTITLRPKCNLVH